jgi:hypothetical protein
VPAALAVVHLDRFAATDGSVATALGAETSRRAYPWGELRLEGRAEGGRIRWDVSTLSGCDG